MSNRGAACPSCGNPLRFRSAATLLVVCDACGVGAFREGVALESVGKVAEVVPIDSVIELGASGTYAGRTWTAIGQIQLDHGAGPWNEWYVTFATPAEGARSETTGMWIAEAQGKLFASRAAPGVRFPKGTDFPPGTQVQVGRLAYEVAERGSARVTAVRGELPRRIVPGESYRYFDCTGPGRRFATISECADGTFEAFEGAEVALADLGIRAPAAGARRVHAVAAGRLACPKCGAGLSLRNPSGTQTVGCGSCASIIDVTSKRAQIVGKSREVDGTPDVALGARGKLCGEEVEAIGFLIRSVTSGGIRYPWSETLLRTNEGAYRWLVRTKGHWSLAAPMQSVASSRGSAPVRFDGREFRHFQGGTAVVDLVLGEMYWQVQDGDETQTADYIHVDSATGEVSMISREWTDDEVTWSSVRYLTTEQVVEAFGGEVRGRPLRGVAVNQPNPFQARAAAYGRTFGILAAALVLLMIVVRIEHANRVVAATDLTAVWADAPQTQVSPEAPPPAGAEVAAQRGVHFIDEFTLTAAMGNVVAELWTPTPNAWVGVDASLVETTTGEVHAFSVGAERWHGVTDGEAWSEGDGTDSVRIGPIPAGTYAMRVEASWAGLAAPSDPRQTLPAKLVVRADVPSPVLPWVLLVLLAVPVLGVWLRARAFETERWSSSDHAGDDS